MNIIQETNNGFLRTTLTFISFTALVNNLVRFIPGILSKMASLPGFDIIKYSTLSSLSSLKHLAKCSDSSHVTLRNSANAGGSTSFSKSLMTSSGFVANLEKSIRIKNFLQLLYQYPVDGTNFLIS